CWRPRARIRHRCCDHSHRCSRNSRPLAATQIDRDCMNARPYALLAELTYKCPLHCPYCSNPVGIRSDGDLTTGEWKRVISEAAALGVLQIGFSGGEPLVRRDLAELIAAA